MTNAFLLWSNLHTTLPVLKLWPAQWKWKYMTQIWKCFIIICKDTKLSLLCVDNSRRYREHFRCHGSLVLEIFAVLLWRLSEISLAEQDISFAPECAMFCNQMCMSTLSDIQVVGTEVYDHSITEYVTSVMMWDCQSLLRVKGNSFNIVCLFWFCNVTFRILMCHILVMYEYFCFKHSFIFSFTWQNSYFMDIFLASISCRWWE
jgi:predicted RNA-binding protein